MRPGWSTTRAGRLVIFAAVWALSVAWIATLVDKGWGPPDEGLLGQTAERLLRGELPHRDFDDFYTGGLTALHALAFKLLGVRLTSLRVVLFMAVVGWVPAVYAVARRFAKPLLAAVVTFTAVAWSVPAYPASMPSWYNLFFATAGLAATLRYLEDERRRWLFAAGLCGGLSILAKVVGIYFVGAVGLLLLYRALDPPEPAPPLARRLGLGAWIGLASAAAIAAALLWLVKGASPKTPGTYLQFVLPGVTIGIVVAGTGLINRRVAWERVWTPLAVLLAGVALPLIPLIGVYVWQHAAGDLFRGVWILPTRRLRWIAFAPRAAWAVWCLPLAAIAVLGLRVRNRVLAGAVAGSIVLGGIWLVRAGAPELGVSGPYRSGAVYIPVLLSIATLLPVLTVAFAELILSSRGRELSQVARHQAFATVTVTVFCALIQFPFSNDLYFHYVAPLLFLSLLAAYAVLRQPMQPAIGTAVIAFYVGFAVVQVPVTGNSLLAVDRGGLRLPIPDSAQALEFVALLRAHARNGYTYATPDCPEAYFLTGLRNPTRIMYERFGDSGDQTDRIMPLLDAYRITAVAVSNWIIASRRPTPRLLEALRARYPDSAVAWHFTVRWSRDREEADRQEIRAP
jgi:hypothetical protein